MYTNSYRKNGKHNRFPIFPGFILGMSLPVHADEGNPTPEGGSPAQPTVPGSMPPNWEDVIARVRKEEKDKLYGEISRLKSEVAGLRKSNSEYILQIADYQKRLETAQQKLEEATSKGDPNEVEQLNAKVAELTAALDEAKKAAPDEEAIREKVKAEYEVQLYIRDKLAEHEDEILTVFRDSVTGSTQEEVDASITAAIEKSTQTKKDLGLIDEDGNPVEPKGKKSKPDDKTKTPPTKKAPPVSAPAAQEDETFDPEYVRNLDPASPEYAEFRKKMGLR